MKLIRELNHDNLIVESKNGEVFIEGIFMQAEIKNINGRVYPVEVLDREVQRYTVESIDRGTALGELGHPDSPNIILERVSHRIVSLQRDGNNFIGKAKLTKTPFGDIARGLLESGTRLGVSSRGLGEVSATGRVKNDFRLITAADIVADPSAPDAWVQSVVENAEWTYVPGRGWIVEQAKKEINARSATYEDRLGAWTRYLARVAADAAVAAAATRTPKS